MTTSERSRRRTSRRAVLLALAASSTGCLRLQSDGNTTSKQPDRETTEASTEVSSPTPTGTATERTTPENRVDLVRRWTVDVDARHLAVGTENVYAAHPDSGVVAYDRGTGERRWHVLGDRDTARVDAYVGRTRTIVPGEQVVVLGTSNRQKHHTVYALDRGGTVLAERDLSLEPQGLALGNEGVVLDLSRREEHEESNDGVTSPCDRAGGPVEWLAGDLSASASTAKPDDACGTTLYGAAGSFALAQDDLYLYGLDAAADAHWTYDVNALRQAVVDREAVYLTTTNRGLVRLARSDGSTAWKESRYTGSRGLARGPEAVYVAGLGLSAVAPGDGSQRWRQSLPGDPLADPLVTDGAIWVVTDEGIVAFDPADGTRLHRSESPISTPAGRAFVDDGLLVVLADGTVYGYAID